MKNKNISGIILALLAAVLYSISTPLSKLLMDNIDPLFMAAFLYIGAGIGILILYLFKIKNEDKNLKLDKSDFIYVLLMVLLDSIAPILMMVGIYLGSSKDSSLLNNFEIVATTLIAFTFFKEKINKKLVVGIILITAASILLSFDFSDKITLSIGSILVLLATISWGLENNCTRKLSEKSTYQIVVIKGLCSGTISLIIAIILNREFPNYIYILYTLLLGFLAYGLSIFLYIRAQKNIGASKTSAFYAVSPFVGSFLAFVFLNETIGITYVISLIIMIAGSIFVVLDTLYKNNDIIEKVDR